MNATQETRPTPTWLVCMALLCALACPVAFAQDSDTPASSTEAGAQSARADQQYSSWTWSNADVRAVFRTLAKVGQVDIVASDAVVGQVTLALTHKTWKEVFNVVCRLRKLTAVEGKAYIYVMTQDEFQSQQLRTATNDRAVEQLAPLHREVMRVNNLLAAEMQGTIQTLLSSRGKITVAQHSNSMIVYDTDDNLAQIRDMVRKLDVETQQISISAKIIEVSSGSLQNVGIQWGLFGNNVLGARGSVEHIPGTQVVANALERLTWGILTQDRLAVTLEYLFTNSKGEVVAQPSITTLDNQEARIFSGGRIPILAKDISGNTIVKYENAGTELIIKPHVTDGSRVMLDINAKKESASPDGEIQSQVATTNVVVNNGETVVIAGLTANEKQTGDEGVPVLKDIPLLGNLFKRSRKTANKKDLIIFVTPHIIQKDVESVAAPRADGAVAGEESVGK